MKATPSIWAELHPLAPVMRDSECAIVDSLHINSHGTAFVRLKKCFICGLSMSLLYEYSLQIQIAFHIEESALDTRKPLNRTLPWLTR